MAPVIDLRPGRLFIAGPGHTMAHPHSVSADEPARGREPGSSRAAALDIDALYRGFHRRAHALAWSYLHDDDDADDAVQEAFVRAKRAVATFNGRAHPHTWMSRIVVNVCLDIRRHRRRRPELVVDDIEAVAPTTSFASPERGVYDLQLRAALNEGLRQLSEDHLQAIVLRELSGLDYEEMAVVGRCPRGTVMSRLFHARRRLRQSIGRQLYVEAIATP